MSFKVSFNSVFGKENTMSKYFDVYVTRKVRVRVIAKDSDDASDIALNFDNHVSEEVLDETTDKVEPVIS